MNAVSKASAFPATVQPGVPKLAPLPNGWRRETIGKFLKETRRPVRMADNEEYQLVTVKRARGGVVPREKLNGREIAVKSQFRISSGDFLISKRQIVHGACGLVPDELDNALVSNEYAILQCTKELDSRFLNYLAHSTYFQQTCFHSSIGVHIEKMIFKLDKWFAWEFNLPPLPEQKKIADILSTWDKALETTEKLLANAEAQKRALMQQLLTGKRRLPGFGGREWHYSQLSAHTTKIGSGITPRGGRNAYKSEGIPLIRSQNVGWGVLSFDDIALIDEEQHEAMQATKVRKGDVLLNITGASIGRAACFDGQDQGANVNQHVCIIRSDGSLDPDYLKAFLLSYKGQKQIDQFQAGGNRQGLNFEQIGSFRIPLPTLSEQQRIANILSTQENIVTSTSAQLTSMREEKRALMQQLLTGKRRVKP